MQVKRLAAVFAFGLAGLLAPAWGATEAQGAARCLECHDDLPDMSRSAHAVATDKRTPDCISCHGESKAHAYKVSGQKQGKPDRMFVGESISPADVRSAACLACHNSTPKLALWAGSQHPTVEVACNSCHKIHTNNDKVRAKATQPEVCYTCHKEQRVQASRPSRHPIQEAKVVCSDCHNPHGSAGPKLVKKDSINDTCFMCHAEKRGPFVHPHQPVTENCANCHNPHGSTVPAMLIARPPLLCQQCHTPHVAGGVGAVGGQSGVFPPAAPGQFAPAVTGSSSGKNVVNIWQGRACGNCHTQVHGSNNPSATNPTPQLLLR
jgi:DmsE family decaheme c-type cytochrome